MTSGDAIAAHFGANLRRIRRQHSISQDRLASDAELHRTEIGHLEHGRRRPRIDTLIKLTAALGVEADELLSGIEWQLPPSEAFYVDGVRVRRSGG